ncbi:XkdQ/YqbQ family protein [Marinicrinis sediminis]|uniref:YqbQ/XkdQ domain-containing protein n=1 Tax=Marinicrinis sediminis TaxID=1652465 RepID=A0ABW5R8F9_9BACL
MSRQIRIVYENKIYMDSIVKSMTWSGEREQGFRKLELDLNNTKNGLTPVLQIEEGKEILMLYQDEEIFRGFIFSSTMDMNGGMSIVAYDANIYLTKTTDSRRFRHHTATQIIHQLCQDYDIPFGVLEDTEYVHPSLIMRNKTLWDMMITALTETFNQTGERFFIYSAKGKLELRKVKTASPFLLQSGFSLLDLSCSRSIEDLRNQIRLKVGDEIDYTDLSLINDPPSIERYGLMQHEESMDAGTNKSQLDQRARQLLRELNQVKKEISVEAIGDIRVTSGSSVRVKETMNQVDAIYYVVSDSHSFSNGVHQMSLGLSISDSLPTLEYTSETTT